jgi:hypothetical protein
MKHRSLAHPVPHSGKIMAAAALIAAAALFSQTARAETAVPLTLPTLYVVAAADTTADDSAPSGFRGRMRERVEQKVQERIDARIAEFEKENPPIDKKLTSDQVRDIVEGQIAMSGNANIKVGKVTAKEDGVVAVDIVTKTGALAATREISTKTGRAVGRDELRGILAGMRGGGHMQGGRMGQGRMGRHDMMRHAMERRGGEKAETRDLALTVAQTKTLMEGRLIILGNKNLKVGAVKEKDADTIAVDIVAADNSLVAERLIDRHTGRPKRG